MNPGASGKMVARLLEASVKRSLADHAALLRRLEAAARCGALFSGAEGASWGIA
jgi:hypothetical protein